MDLEDSALLNLCNKGPEAVLDYIYAKHSIKDHFYLMIDEIQYLEEPSSFLKIIHDHYKEKGVEKDKMQKSLTKQKENKGHSED